LIKNISPTPPNARDDQPRTSVPQLPLRRSANPPGRGPLHTCFSTAIPFFTRGETQNLLSALPALQNPYPIDKVTSRPRFWPACPIVQQ
jgi:hypothetical protein